MRQLGFDELRGLLSHQTVAIHYAEVMEVFDIHKVLDFKIGVLIFLRLEPSFRSNWDVTLSAAGEEVD